MKFLTIRQPWASLIEVGAKTIETRSWSTKYRGPLAIHAGKARPTIHMLVGWTDVTGEPIAGGADPCWLNLTYPAPPLPLPLGAVVAVCDLVDVVPIVDDQRCSGYNPHVCLGHPYALMHSPLDNPWPDGETEHDVSDQLPFGNFEPGNFAWLLDNVRTVYPVPMKGAQGLRDLPDGIAQQLKEVA